MQSLDQVQDLQDQLQQARQVISHLASQVDHYQDLHKQLAGDSLPLSALLGLAMVWKTVLFSLNLCNSFIIPVFPGLMKCQS